VENVTRDRSSQRSRDESVDSLILLDEPSNDPLTKRINASSSLLSSFVDSSDSSLKYVFLFVSYILCLSVGGAFGNSFWPVNTS